MEEEQPGLGVLDRFDKLGFVETLMLNIRVV